MAYVSRAGEKLEFAIKTFNISVKDLICADFGSNTGGFVDVLLTFGARKVYSVETGHGVLDWKLRQDNRVVVMEKTDIRDCLGKIEPVDFVTVDISFISVIKVIDVIARLLKPAGKIIILIKPQFETEKKSIARGGIVKNTVVRKQICKDVIAKIEHAGFKLQGCTESLTVGGDGNIEFLAYFIKNT